MSWETLPEWIKLATASSLSALGTIVAGYFVARSDNQNTRSTDRVEFTSQVLSRLAAVEQQMKDERVYCEQRLSSLREEYELRLSSRDETIADLHVKDENRERRLVELERRLRG